MLTKEFVTAGRAVFTVDIPPAFARQHRTPPHYTFRVKRSKDKTAYFLQLLTGPDNTNDYTYVGLLTPVGGVKLTAKSRYKSDTMVVRLATRVLARIWNQDFAEMAKSGFKLHHEGRCGRCGRVLTVPSSIETGLGPECAGKL